MRLLSFGADLGERREGESEGEVGRQREGKSHIDRIASHRIVCTTIILLILSIETTQHRGIAKSQRKVS